MRVARLEVKAFVSMALNWGEANACETPTKLRMPHKTRLRMR